jgi:large subunit ribosomal protein L18
MITKSRQRRKKRIKEKVRGTKKVPRLSVFRSNNKIYAQLIDDEKKITLASAFGKDSEEVGRKIAKKARAKKITKAVFDRSGYQYHGRIKVLAESSRKEGLKI